MRKHFYIYMLMGLHNKWEHWNDTFRVSNFRGAIQKNKRISTSSTRFQKSWFPKVDLVRKTKLTRGELSLNEVSTGYIVTNHRSTLEQSHKPYLNTKEHHI